MNPNQRGILPTGAPASRICSWGLLLMCAIPAGALGQEGRPVAEVRFTGHQRSTEAYMGAVVQTRPGGVFSRETVDGDVVRLMRTGRFLSVDSGVEEQADGVVVTFDVRERATIHSVRFVGNRVLDDATLRERVPLAEGDPFDAFGVREGGHGIEAAYREKGHGYVTVAYDVESARESGEVVYTIEEGPRVRVTEVTIEGNHSIDRRELMKRVKSRSALWIIRPGTFDVELVESDAVALQNFYRDEGFLDARVSYRVDSSGDPGDLEVVFIISEGDPYRIEAVHIEGAAVLTTGEALAILNLELESVFKQRDLDRGLDALNDYYGERGYIYARINAVRVFSTSPGYVVLNVRVEEGESFRVGRVVVRGNEHTQDKVVRRELKLFPGDVYDATASRKAEDALRGTQIFERVSITPAGDQPSERDVLVSVVETEQTNDLIFGFGVTSNNGLVGSILYDTPNFDYRDMPRSFSEFIKLRAFRGTGQRFRLELQPGTDVNRFRVDFTEPYLFDQPVRFDLGVYHFTRGREAYDESRSGGLVSFGRTLEDGWGPYGWFQDWYREVAFRTEYVKIDEDDIFDHRSVREAAGGNFLTSAKLTLVRDRTDNRFLPSSGDRITLSYEQFIGEWNFGRARMAYATHRTLDVDELDRKHILSWRADVGFNLGSAPIFEKFYAGGLGSIRGFEFRGVGPRGGLLERDPIGGDFSLTTSFEYTFPLYTDMLRGVLFTDMGTVEENFGLTQWRASVGFGVRMTIDLFGPLPIELDFAIPILKDPEDEGQVFSFYIGRVF